MPKLFISYRREDSADATGRLHDRLKDHFGEESLFFDLDSIPIGLDFRKYITDEIAKCDVLLAIIGEAWISALDHDGKRRLDNPNDLVRIEIEAALARGIPVVPVLVGRALIPAEKDLPDGLKGLARRNAAEVRPGGDFNIHSERLIRGLERLFREARDLGQRMLKANDLADDPEIALVPSRQVLEIAVREMYERRTGEPVGFRTLEKLTQLLVERGAFPGDLNALTVVQRLERSLARATNKKITKTESSQLLADVMAIVKWYMTIEQPDRIGQIPVHSSLASTADSPHGKSRIHIVPKGLRAFDANDADFFLDLLPGPRDKDGLPESIRFWKHRIEETEEATFSVGVIFGPSGCGKSSLMKAGLLPRLSGNVISIYVEATADETEFRLLNGLRKRFPGVSEELNLTRFVEYLRQDSGNKKILLIIDQFEQWLHVKQKAGSTELAQSLRQCDGEHVQCVILVRDDFWVGLSRFFNELQIELRQGQNIALVDLFDPIHARNVLAAFGRAFGRLLETLSKEQEAFLDQAVAELSQDGWVIPVRLALFAEMVKGKAWTPSTLKDFGGTQGVGVAFLEETFTAATAPPEHRYHQKAAQAVVKALLPAAGMNIRGHMRSRQELLTASGYANRPNYFEALVRILNSELRLITPTDPDGKSEDDLLAGRAATGQKFFQLTHDYLVPSLREWLNRSQKKSWRGRAEFLLDDLATAWTARPEGRQLPAWWEWLSIRLLTRKRSWTSAQDKMMRKADVRHLFRAAVLTLLLTIAITAGWFIRNQFVEKRNATRAIGLAQTVLNADTTQVSSIVDEMSDYRKWTDPLLRQEFDRAEQKSRRKLHASLALLPVDNTQVDYLYDRLLEAEPRYVSVIRDALAPFKEKLVGKLWVEAQNPEAKDDPKRLRAAAALSEYDAASMNWTKVSSLVADQLVAENPVFLGLWMQNFHRIKSVLKAPLETIYRSRSRRESERSLATSLLAEYAADDPQTLAKLLMDADENQFAVLYPLAAAHRDLALSVLIAEIDRILPTDWPSSDERRENLSKRQANAAVALLRMNHPEKVWPLLKHSFDPRTRSYIIHRLSLLGADARTIVRRLNDEPDLTVRRALILSLGQYRENSFTADERKKLLQNLQEIYRTASDPGLHAASEWLLRTWKADDWLKRVNEEGANDKVQRETRLAVIKQLFAKERGNASPQWFVDGVGQTMVAIPGPQVFDMGSPKGEKDRNSDEVLHKRRIGRAFAIANKSVTLGQYRAVTKNKDYETGEKYNWHTDLPVVRINWFMAARYCNLLSKAEGIDENQWCYETNAKGDVVSAKANYLSLAGYRLPTEAEMEFATRSGAITCRFFGETEELMEHYAWYIKNSNESIWPVGIKKPNELGLFDVQGNCFTWCQEPFGDYPIAKGDEPIEDKENKLEVLEVDRRVLRGGSFDDPALNTRSANRFDNVPSNRNYSFGLRPVRTLVVFPATTSASAKE